MSHGDTTVTFRRLLLNGNRTSVCNRKLSNNSGNLKGESERRKKPKTIFFFSDCGEVCHCPSKCAHLLATVQEAPHYSAPVEVTWLKAAFSFLRTVGPSALDWKAWKKKMQAVERGPGHRSVEGHHPNPLCDITRRFFPNCLFLHEAKRDRLGALEIKLV